MCIYMYLYVHGVYVYDMYMIYIYIYQFIENFNPSLFTVSFYKVL